MRGKGPEDVFLPPDLAQVEAVRVDVVDPPQFSGRSHLLELDEGRVVLQEVPHHENPAALWSAISMSSRPSDSFSTSGFST